jgi:FimV-like protein
MNSLLRLPTLTLSASVLILSQLPLAYAADKSIEVKSGDTLSTIIAEHYPSYKNNKALMQALFDANPASFKNQSIHQLIVGKSLNLPDPASIPDLQAATPKVETTSPADSAQSTKELDDLKAQVTALETEKAQLNQQVADLNAAKPAETTTTSAPAGDAIDPAILMQQLDEIESANEQILADKNKLVKEQEDLKKQLQTLESAKQQLETKLAEQTNPQPTSNEVAVTGTESTAAADAPDPAILMQQLDEIESANQQILADKKQLEQERDQLKQQLQTLQADNKQAEATISSNTASTATSTANPAEETPDAAFLSQQLDEIESANEQLLTDKKKLQSDLETAQQQLKEREQTMSALSGQLSENKQQLDTTQKDLQLAKAAQANAELTQASLEKQRGSWLPWLLALVMLPIGWLLGRKGSSSSSDTKPTTPQAEKSASTAATPTAQLSPTAQDAATVVPPLASTAPAAAAASVSAANDDNVDAAIKLDIVRAYLDLRDPTAASTLLKEVLREGGRQQQQEAREILSFLA